jgi:3-oxoacyl-[acyl-carrier-protein] synthase-3
MARSVFDKVKISGICTVVPAREVCIDDEMEIYGSRKNIERTKRIVGINKRRVSDKGVTASDLSECAAKKLIKEMNTDKEEIDALLFVVQSPDFLAPATSFYLHKQLGLSKNCAVFDINHGCAGYTYGLWVSSCLIQTGSCRKVLLLVGDRPAGGKIKGDSSLLFGDAGSATLLEYAQSANPSYYILGSDGTGYEAIIVPDGLARHPYNLKNIKDYAQEDGTIAFRTRMDGLRVFDFTVEVVPANIREVLEFAGKTKEEVDCFVLHQANKYILENIADQLNVPLEKVPYSTLEKYGNLSSASVPSVICDVLREKVSTSKQTVILSGFGIGLAWASCLLDLENIYCPEIIDYKGQEQSR